jgi:hypothetical protein
MAAEWQEILQSLQGAGFKTVRWAVIGAKHAGSPMERLRWLCLASRSELPPWVEDAGQVPAPCGDNWNEFSSMPPAAEWSTAYFSTQKHFLLCFHVQFALDFELRGCSRGRPTRTRSSGQDCGCAATSWCLSRCHHLCSEHTVPVRTACCWNVGAIPVWVRRCSP